MADETAKTTRKRDPAATKERILRAGLVEFGAKGYSGARTAQIAKRAKSNNRMINHYFGGKEDLYLACLDRVYLKIRAEEQKLELTQLSPPEAIRKLVEFTFDHMQANPDFVNLAGIENTHRGKFVKKLPKVANAAAHLIETIDGVLQRGVDEGAFRHREDAFQLYVSILALSYVHLSNRHTLSITYGRDLSDREWLAERRIHACRVILSSLI